MMNPMLMQLLQQQQQQGQMPAGILGQEIDAQAFGGPGFLGQVDAQPHVGAAQPNQAMDPQMLQAMMRMGQGMQQPQQQQAPPQMMQMPHARQTTPMPDQSAMMQMLARRGNMPSITGPLGGGF